MARESGTERYSRQTAFHGVGRAGQQKLSEACITIVGMGALGTAAADRLCRAGIGRLRLIDDDIVELSNLQRQALYTEADIGKLKAETSRARLHEINSEIHIETICERLANDNSFLQGASLVLDCTDNPEARFLINSQCHALGVPWVHGAVAGASGVVFAIVPGGACFRCLYPDTTIHGETAATIGVLNPLTAIVGALQANEAMKLLLGRPAPGLLMLDIWNDVFEYIEVKRDLDCPVCGGKA